MQRSARPRFELTSNCGSANGCRALSTLSYAHAAALLVLYAHSWLRDAPVTIYLPPVPALAPEPFDNFMPVWPDCGPPTSQ
eukprot:IDg19244t1